MKSKILMIYTGGTIGMFKNSSGSLEPFDFKHLMNYLPELKQFDVQIDSIAFAPVDSATITPDLWIKLVETIEKKYIKYDGFIILHGTDTMAFSASALSFMIENLQKPVIFTGSQLPIGQLRTDGKENLITSIEIAASKENNKAIVPEVCIFYQNKLFRGNRSRKYNAEYFDAFESPNYPLLAEAGISIKYNKYAINKFEQNKIPRFHKKLDKNVFVIKLFPGIPYEYIETVVNIQNLKGIVLETYGAGNAPTDKKFLDILRVATEEKGIIIINVSQCNAGSVKMGLYEASSYFEKIGIVCGKDITTEAALVKMMYLFSLDLSHKEIKKYLSENIAGEMS